MTTEREGQKHLKGHGITSFSWSRCRETHENVIKRKKANEKPYLVDFSTCEGIVNLPPSDFLGSMLLRRWQ
jgi:hypothetical protein